MGKRISLTVDERVILHLYEFIPFEEDFEAPGDITQAGIARGVGIERKHVPRAVKKLMSENLVETRVSHVKGGRQRKKVYYLTFEGKALARRIWESLAKKSVIIREDDGREKETSFSELCFTYQVGKTPIQLLMDLKDGNYFYPHEFSENEEPSKKKKEKKTEEVHGAKDIYKKALKKAWEDSILTKDESALLKELRDSLGISEQEHRMLQEEIIGGNTDVAASMNKMEVYKKILEVALRDGRITEDEQDILDELERSLALDKETITQVKMEMKLLEGEGVMTREKKHDNFRDIYSSVIRESLKDGRISRDEQNIIILLKKLMEIEDQEHLKIFKSINEDDR
jgi:DNA-binding MarR family transcriptional regulator